MPEANRGAKTETQDAYNAWVDMKKPIQLNLWGGQRLARYDPKEVKCVEPPVPPVGMEQLSF